MAEPSRSRQSPSGREGCVPLATELPNWSVHVPAGTTYVVLPVLLGLTSLDTAMCRWDRSARHPGCAPATARIFERLGKRQQSPRCRATRRKEIRRISDVVRGTLRERGIVRIASALQEKVRLAPSHLRCRLGRGVNTGAEIVGKYQSGRRAHIADEVVEYRPEVTRRIIMQEIGRDAITAAALAGAVHRCVFAEEDISATERDRS